MSGLPESGHMAGIGGRLKQAIAAIAAIRRTKRYGISDRNCCHCGLMLAATITLPHFLVSSEMSLPKSAGEPASTVPPRLASRALNFGSAVLILTSLFSLS